MNVDMGQNALIATETLDAITAEAIAHPEREVCGLLLGDSDRITGRVVAANVAPDPRRAFEIDPAALLRVHREQRRGGPAIVGCYHSHPTGSSRPSPCDADDAQANGWLWLIVAGRSAQLWRAVPDGAVHGRFEPVPFTCVAAPHSSESALSRRKSSP